MTSVGPVLRLLRGEDAHREQGRDIVHMWWCLETFLDPGVQMDYIGMSREKVKLHLLIQPILSFDCRLNETTFKGFF